MQYNGGAIKSTSGGRTSYHQQQQHASNNYTSSNLRVKTSQSPERNARSHSNDNNKVAVPPTANSDFTEVFSWGSDRHGQLGLGSQMSAGKALHNLPRFCSYNIPIFQISCGEKHAAFITSKLKILPILCASY